MTDKNLDRPGVAELAGGQEAADAQRRERDGLSSLIQEVRGYARVGGVLDLSERDALAALADRASLLDERLQAVIDWADFALRNPQEFDSHGVRNLDGPVFDEARTALLAMTGSPPETPPSAAFASGSEPANSERLVIPRDDQSPQSDPRRTV